METIRWVQDTGFATWIRESSWAIFAFLIVHTISMGFLVGTGLAVDARVVGLGKRIPLPAIGRALPIMAIAVLFAVPSGVLLLIAYPAKALTNPLFYVKLTLVVAALAITVALNRRVFALALAEPPAWARGLAGLCLVFWISALTAGKFLEYTHHVLLVY
ncbi:MAG: hypothetical protein JWO33_2959 [Caulobacteraceae bacterium]|nr:hypothetical protein [Caulobacteraceae bacterium]